jgi:hypothetical protein
MAVALCLKLLDAKLIRAQDNPSIPTAHCIDNQGDEYGKLARLLVNDKVNWSSGRAPGACRETNDVG